MNKELKKLELLKLKNKLMAKDGRILAFTKQTMPEYEINWHHEILAEYIDKFICKEIKRLMIFMPPRHGKSEITSRRLPALLHGIYPNDEILAASYNSDLAAAMTVDVQRIMDRTEYQELFPLVKLTQEGSKSGYARNSNEHEIKPFMHEDRTYTWHKGSYKSAGVGGSFTGRGANWIIIDDPIKNREDADSAAFREKLWSFWSSTLRTRLEKNGSVLITLTRWHDDDLAGRLLRQAKSNPDADQWTVLTLPAIKVDETNTLDPRELGEPLWKNKYDLESLVSTKATLGSREWTALYQQSPTAEGGNIIKTDWFQYYYSLPQKFDQMIQSWDFAVKDKKTSDYTVGQVWGRVGAKKYLIYQIRGRFDFPTACQKVIDVTRSFPNAHKKYVEAKANGPAIVQTLRKQVSGLVEVEPRGDKVARVHAITPEFESGCVYLPHPEICPWISDYTSELASFPTGVNDDQVDASSQALDELRRATKVFMPIAGHGGS